VEKRESDGSISKGAQDGHRQEGQLSLASTLIAQDSFSMTEAIGSDHDVEKGTMRPARCVAHVPKGARRLPLLLKNGSIAASHLEAGLCSE